MTKDVSKTQVDRLGNRLKSGGITEEDLRLLDQYRRSFTEAYEIVVGLIRDKLGLEPTGRPAKSTTSIADKLKRESIRLTQIQDIAGCRIIVSDIAEQETVIQSITGLFQQAIVIDRREKPSHGYRAVHVVMNYDGKLIEIQVRTSLQHVWAELSEKYSDVIDPSIKYGGGDSTIQKILQTASNVIAKEELGEKQIMDTLALSSSNTEQINDAQQTAARAQELKQIRLEIYQLCRSVIDKL
jgi:putative GTP pyrophosphokinase